MKQKLTLLLTAFMLVTGMSLWGQSRTEASIDFSEQGYANAQDMDGVIIEIDDNVTVVFNKASGNNGPKYYNTGTAIRAYGGNNFVVSSTGTISSITLTFGSGDGSNEITTEVGGFESPVWTGSESEVTFTIGGTSGHRRIKGIDVVYSSGGAPQLYAAMPTFSPEAGVYYEPQTITISCETEGATIHYTTDGITPTEESPIYNSPFSINETTTVKAKAWKAGYQPSPVATATYSITNLITIAEARALDINEYALVQGIVNFIDNRNVYVQDNTGGICLFLNNNTVPSNLALGDMVQAYGKRANYNGLAELSNINGGNSDEFSILSSGNALPIAVKTIAEILEGGADALQCTRVKIESAILGATTGNNTPLTQNEYETTIYKMPTLTDIEAGDEVDVIGVVGYFNAPQIRVALASDIVLSETPIQPDPELNISATQLNEFSYVFGAGPSSAKTFTISGSNLTTDVTLTSPQDYELSLNPDNGYTDSDELSPVSGTLAEALVYVRMKSGLNPGSYSESLSIVSGELTYTITLNGIVDEMPMAATPTFSPTPGSYFFTQMVTISTETENATIHYTVDGSDPTETSDIYTEPLEISATTTIKAIAVCENYNNSTIATATYTIAETMTIAEARALEINAYACVEGTVIFIDGRNVYVQDETAGIDLYLNNNTVPANLAIGDNVRAYGKRANYNGLAELSGINGGNTNAFSILSSGNELPLAIKTIAEINTDYTVNNMLQSTRVKIQNAIIGTINPSGTTVISQEGNNLNVYHIPTVEGLIEGDHVTITGVIGCYNAPQLRVVSADDIEFAHSPSLTVSPMMLSGFEYVYETGGPSNIQFFTVGGDMLTHNVNIIPSENFEISTLPAELFQSENPATIYTPNSGHFYGIKIYVRLKAGLEMGTYNEQIVVASEDADTLYVNVSGVVTSDGPTPPTPPSPSDGNYVRISDVSTLTAGSYIVIAARFDENAADYYAMSNTSSGKPTGVLFTSATSGSDEVLPATITDEEANFYWVVGVTDNGYTFTNAEGEQIGYSASTNFATDGDNTEWTIELSTAGDEAMVPGYTGFLINNVNNPARYFALNSNHNYGAYHTNNINSSGYNFYLDIFVKTEGGVPPTPTVATPTFSPAGGTYFEAQTVSIACLTEGATIYYSTESANGPWTAYQNAITVDDSMTLWAYAEKEGYNNSNVAEATYIIQVGVVTIFNQDWEGEMNGWTFVDVEGEMSWTVAQYSGNHYAYANGYNHGANTDWCISPAFNLTTIGNPVLSFRTAKNYTGPDLEVFFSNDYDGEHPASATWIPLTCALSTGSWTWIESGDISLGSFSGTNCYIGFKYTCEENSAAGWEVDDIVLVGQTSDPVVTVTPLALSGFTYVEGEGPSAEQSFAISGFNLSGNITITAPTHYEISQTSGSGFTQSPITLAPVGGNVEETTIYVRLKSGLAVGTYNDEDITVSSTDVDDIDVTCSGNVSAQPIPGDDYVRISDVSELAAGNRIVFAARFDENATDYYAMSSAASGHPTGVLFTSSFNGSDEILPSSILNEEDNFYWTVDITADGYTFTNAAGDMVGYTSGTNFAPNGNNTAWNIEIGTSEETAMVPNYTGFVITNVNNPVRAFALNGSHNFGPYHMQNIAGENYNFFLDIFMQGEGGIPPTPTVATPTFAPPGGTYYEGQTVTINCTTADATIHYTLDGTDPNLDSPVYSTPLYIDTTTTINAYAVKDGYNDSPIVTAEYIIQDDIGIIFNQDWEDDWNGWTEVCVIGDSLWRIASYQGNHYAYANGYNHPASEDWLISPAFDLDSYSDVVLTFITAKNYTGPELEVYFSNDYDGQNPITATWEPLECELSQGGWNWTSSGDISLDDFSGTNCYIGFRYTCTDDEAAGWEVDDIMLVSGSATPTPTLTATPNIIYGLDYTEGYGPSTSQNYTLTGANLEGEGDITLTVNEYFEILQDDGSYDHTLQIHYANGQLENQPVAIYVRLIEGLEVGTYTDTINHECGGAYTEVILNGTVHSENEPAILMEFMPLYIQGNNGSNNNRVPVAIEMAFTNLEPNTTYRYTNQFVDGNDGPETAGAGNVIYANEDGFYRSTSPSLATEGSYGEFTTNEVGDCIFWFINEPTANARFTPGNHVYLRIRINDGHDGTTVFHTFTTQDYATVLNFGKENDEFSGSAFYVKSNEAPMTFAMLYASPQSDWRPVYSTPVETTGVDFGNINQYADFYKESVAGNDGWFGGILPNDNETGINSIWIYDINGFVENKFETQDGQWYPEANTVNPTNGLDEPIFIDLIDDGVEEDMATNVKIWNADHEFVIENGDNAHYNMTVYNILGQPMMMKQINAGSTEHISHSLASGVYVISLQNNQNKVSVKIIVR